MKRWFRLLIWLFAAGILSASALDIGQQVARMKSIGKPQQIGKTPETGYYVICIEEIAVTDEMSDNMAKELGLAQAKRSIAGLFNTRVQASTTQSRETVVETRGADEEKALTREMTREMTRIDINQLLKGIAVYRAERRDRNVEVVCFFSEKLADASRIMARAVEDLPPGTVVAVGIGMPQGAPDSARDNALQAAKRLAIEQVLGTAVAGTTQVQDDKIKAKIFASSGGFIETYRIIEETVIPGGYKVAIVAVVAKDKLLADYSAFVKAMGDPAFYVRADNQELYLTFVKFFSGLGLRLVAAPQEADYVIDAIGEYRQLKHPASGRDGVQLSLWIRIFDVKSNRELLSQKNDPRQAAVFHAAGDRQKDIATEKAFAQIREPLHRELNHLIGKMAASGRPVQIVIDNYSDAFARELELISGALAMLPGCSTPNLKIDGVTQQVTMTADYAGSMDTLENLLRSAMNREIDAKARIPKTVSISANRLELSF